MRNTACYLEGLEQRGQGIVAWEVVISQDEMEDLPMAQRQYEIQKGMQEPVVYAASANPDIMYLHEVMKVPDRDQFKKAMDKELQDHIAHRHWEVVPHAWSTNGRHGSMYMVANSNEASTIGRHMRRSSLGKPFASSSCWQSSGGGESAK